MICPLVYVIVVNWNGLAHLPTCLSSLSRINYPNVRLLVVDNGSQDGSQEYISTFSQCVLIQNRNNIGFAGGSNLGIRYALENGAQYVVLLNNDTRVPSDWLSELVEVAEQDPAIGLCESQQYTWDGRYHIQFLYRPEWADGEILLKSKTQNTKPRPVIFGSGCSLLARASVLREVGLFDSRYFAGVEDIDLSLRVWIAGYRVLSVPTSVVYHRMSASSNLFKRMFWGYRNQLHTLFKNYELDTLRKFSRAILCRWFLTRNRVALRAACVALADIGTTLKLRSDIQRRRRLRDQEIFAIANV